MIFVFNSFIIQFPLVFEFHYYFTTHLKVNPKYRQRLKWHRCWHIEGSSWNRPHKAAGEAVAVVSVSEPCRTAGVNAEPDGVAQF